MTKKQLIITRLFEFGGSNSHLGTLVKYWGKENLLLVIEDGSQLAYLKKMGLDDVEVIKQPLHPYARLNHRSTLTNVRELRHIMLSLFRVFYWSLRNNFAGITINSTEPIKLLYLLWLPFVRVNYILHTTPEPTDTAFTTVTCNRRLGQRKKIITVSQATKLHLCKSWAISEQKQQEVKVVYNCVPEPAAVPPTPLSPRVKGGLVLTMGYMIDYKNPAAWLQVARKITAQREGVSFVWLGNGPLYEEFVQETTNDDRIIFAGLAANPSAYLARAQIYYQPSLYETQGIAVLEAMAHQIPCVVTATGGLPESVTDGFNGFLVATDNLTQHTNKLLTLIDDEKLCAAYGRNGYEKYRKSFTFDAFEKRMDGIYAG